MARKKKQTTESIRTRRPARTVDSSFRRNNVVVSRAQKEVAARQRSVTQRQIEKKHLQQQRLRRHRMIVVVAILLMATFFYRSTISSVTIASANSSTLPADQRAVYETALQRMYREHTIAGQSWLVNAPETKQEFLATYPEVERVSFSSRTPLSTALKADVRFRAPVFTWKDASGTQQFVDQHGVLFSKNMNTAVNTESLIQIEDQSGVVLQAGTSVLTDNLIAFVGQLHSTVPQLFGKDAKITGVIIPKSTREVQIRVSGIPYIVKFNSFRDIEQQVGELKGLLAHLTAQKVTPAKYIDLRVEHKAFYQ